MGIHGAALDRDQHVIGEADGLGEQGVMARRQVDEDIAAALLRLRGCGFDCLFAHRGDGDEAACAGNRVPAADPAARIGIEDGDAVAAAGEFAGENEDCGRLACAALGIGKCQYWHIFSLMKQRSEPSHRSMPQPGFHAA